MYWRGEWGTQDYDLSFLKSDGCKIGWNAGYYDEDQAVVYSGDMTSACPEASELIVVRGKQPVPNGVITLNRYNGKVGAKFRLFFGQDVCKDLRKGYVVDPDSIILQEDETSKSADVILGAVCDNKFYFNMIESGSGHVSYSDVALQQTLRDQCLSYLPLKPVLLGAGYIEYTDEHSKLGIEPNIDLTDLHKDTLIKLFANPADPSVVVERY